jgi:hypothetical protein
MKHYYFNYHANYITHMGSFWALSRYDVERMILSKHPKATNIDIWVR